MSKVFSIIEVLEIRVGDDKTTWEPIDNLIGTCDILLNEYRIKNGLQIDDTASNGGNGSSSVASSSQ